jgi:hypothetical protein
MKMIRYGLCFATVLIWLCAFEDHSRMLEFYIFGILCLLMALVLSIVIAERNIIEAMRNIKFEIKD